MTSFVRYWRKKVEDFEENFFLDPPHAALREGKVDDKSVMD